MSELVVQVFRLNGLLLPAGDAMAEPAGQTSARWRVLAAIEDAPLVGGADRSRLAASPGSVQRVADLLVRDGLPRTRTTPTTAAPSSSDHAERAVPPCAPSEPRQRAWADALGAELGEADLRKANSVLARVLDALTSS